MREEIVRRLFEDFAGGRTETAFEVYDPNVVWDGTPLGPEAGELATAHMGHEGVRRWWRDWLEAWERIENQGDPEFRSNGNQLVATWVQHNIGRASGVEVEQHSALVFTFEDGRIVRVGVYPNWEHAWRAAGISA